uniref:Uncharacterized protein n=1 Tax=Dendroctonus ponderosae TaxID=77166 RepID=A0AAR5PQI1_DENPD
MVLCENVVLKMVEIRGRKLVDFLGKLQSRVILTQNPSIMHGAVLFTAILYLSMIHLYRQLFDDSSFGLDISGPLMVITQKVTSLAFSLHDGMVENDEKLTETQRSYALKKVPNLLEFFSYSLMFPSLMAGPAMFYKDYIEFIEGNSLMDLKKSTPSSKPVVVHEPNLMKVVFKKLALAIVCALVFVLFLPRFPITRLKDEDFINNTTFTYKFWYLSVATSLVRAKYYFAWTLADAICNNAGMGWDGSSWSRYTNVDIFRFELGTSLKESIEAWNKGTNQWLRFIVYKRSSSYSTLATFALSAIWHGFYPGYYITFLSGALFTFASRTMHRHLRPHFMYSSESKVLYNIITFAATRLVMVYITFPFVLLEFSGSVLIYHKLYWVFHIFACLTLWMVPQLLPKDKMGEMIQKNGIAIALSKAGPYSEAVGKID